MAFLFYSLVILKGILPTRFLNHFFLCVYGIHLLLGDKISSQQIRDAEVALTKFVIEFEQLYGIRRCSFNVHCLIHMAYSVRNCGPLWATSAFMFEAHNHTLAKMFKGTQHVPKQIVETFLLTKKANRLADSHISDSSSPTVVHLLEKFQQARQLARGKLCGGVEVLGKSTKIELTASEILAVQDLLGDSSTCNRSAMLFERFLVNHQIYCGTTYQRAKRHSNTAIVFGGRCYGMVKGLILFKPHCRCDPILLQYCACRELVLVLVEVLVVTKDGVVYKDCDFSRVASSVFLHQVDKQNIVALNPTDIDGKCIFMDIGGSQFVCKLPCRLYGD